MSNQFNLKGHVCVLMNAPLRRPGCQLLDDVVAPLLTKPGKAAKEDNEYVRKGTGVVLLAYDLDKGLRYTQVRKRRTKADYAEFMEQEIETHYADVEWIDLIQDNLNTHKYGSFYEHLPVIQARTLSRKLVFHYTPKHGSWLNVAEIDRAAGAVFCFGPAMPESTHWQPGRISSPSRVVD